jgi:hypothetical protein
MRDTPRLLRVLNWQEIDVLPYTHVQIKTLEMLCYSSTIKHNVTDKIKVALHFF